MKKVLFGATIGFVVAGLLSLGTMLIAQEQTAANTFGGPVVVLAGLKLLEGAEPEGAEKLLKEQLIPAITGIDGLKMKVLKSVKTPWGQTANAADPGAYDYIMAAEIEKIQVLIQLIQGKDEGLSNFGDMMKEYAGRPHFNAYVVVAETE